MAPKRKRGGKAPTARSGRANKRPKTKDAAPPEDVAESAVSKPSKGKGKENAVSKPSKSKGKEKEGAADNTRLEQDQVSLTARPSPNGA
jgi:hypothetical protein